MKLINATIRPGVIVQVLENGNIKASVPGLFSSQDDPELLPAITPFFIGSYSNAYTQPTELDEVWIINFVDNPQQLYWFRKDNYIENNKEILQEENVEIICNRESGVGWATIYFSDGSGWVIKKDDSKFQIRSDGSLVMQMNWPNRTIDINSDGISLGLEGKSNHKAAYGDQLELFCEELLGLLKKVALSASMNPYTAKIGMDLNAGVPTLQNMIGKLTSSHVTLQ